MRNALLASLLLSSSLLVTGQSAEAQTAPCFSLNTNQSPIGTSITVIPFNGRNRWAYEIVPTQDVRARAIRINTENRFRTGFMHVELWDNNPGLAVKPPKPHPGKMLARGSWKNNQSRLVAWQGANLDRPVDLVAGTKYWVVWDEPGGSQPPYAPFGNTTRVLRAASSATFGWQNAGVQEVMVRVYCSILDDANVAVVGATCQSSTGTDATIFTNEPPRVGNRAFAIEGNGFPPGQIGLMLLDVNSSITPFTNPLFPAGCQIALLPAVNIPGGSTMAPEPPGQVCFALPLQNRRSWRGAVLRLQVGVVDLASGAGLPVVLSNGLDCTLF